MALRKLGEKRIYIHCSSSISNWKEKILRRYDAEEYILWKHWRKDVTFFGFYNPKDWVKFWLHRGKKTIHWCGSDILQVGYLFRWLAGVRCDHICENNLQFGILNSVLHPGVGFLRINRIDDISPPEISLIPTFLSDPNDFEISYKSNNNPNVWLHVNKNSEFESGLGIVKRISLETPEITYHIYGKCSGISQSNIVFHGYVSERKFNQEIKEYQAGLRLHEFDGFSEVISKSVLLGQYPISCIRYPFIDTYKNEQELIEILKELKNKKIPNYEARNYYMRKFNESVVKSI